MADRTPSSAAALEADRGTASDRRDSARVALPLLVREVALGGSFEAFPGHLSLWGVDFEALHPPVGGRFEVRFLLPGTPEVEARAELLRVSRDGERYGAHLRFLDLPLEAELAIARYLEP
jgi:hypothetical protein